MLTLSVGQEVIMPKLKFQRKIREIESQITHETLQFFIKVNHDERPNEDRVKVEETSRKRIINKKNIVENNDDRNILLLKNVKTRQGVPVFALHFESYPCSHA